MPLITETGNTSNSHQSAALEGMSNEFIPYISFDKKSYKSETGNNQNDTVSVSDDETVKLEKYFKEDFKNKKLDVISVVGEVVEEKNVDGKVVKTDKLYLGFDILNGTGEDYDPDGVIDVIFTGADAGKVSITEPKELPFAAKFSDHFLIEVTIDVTEQKKEMLFYVDFIANDNKGVWLDDEGETKDVFCGRIGIEYLTLDKDIFKLSEVSLLIAEIIYLKPFADAGKIGGYRENYCMQAAERGLSELLDNDIDFYSVERITHKRKNKISFSGLNAIDRGNLFKALGFVKSTIEFDLYTINQNERISIKTYDDYDKVKYSILSLKAENEKILLNNFSEDIENRKGFHVYYLSITGGFHTLLLVIDNRDHKKATYAIYDQHGPTSSSGKLDEITEGLRKQTSWTFANTCLNRYESHLANNNNKHKKWDGLNTTLWKIQRK